MPLDAKIKSLSMHSIESKLKIIVMSCLIRYWPLGQRVKLYFQVFYLVCALACSLLAIQSRLDTYIFSEKMRRKIAEECP